jgi:hypothetical protein
LEVFFLFFFSEVRLATALNEFNSVGRQRVQIFDYFCAL